MANWDFIYAFNSEAADWLDGENLPHPTPSTSLMPTTNQIVNAWRQFDDTQSVLIDGFDWDSPNDTPDDGFKMRGDLTIELEILKSICQSCGQLWLYPDTGTPAIIVDATIDPVRVTEFHKECNQFEDSWERFYRGQYET